MFKFGQRLRLKACWMSTLVTKFKFRAEINISLVWHFIYIQWQSVSHIACPLQSNNCQRWILDFFEISQLLVFQQWNDLNINHWQRSEKIKDSTLWYKTQDAEFKLKESSLPAAGLKQASLNRVSVRVFICLKRCHQLMVLHVL